MTKFESVGCAIQYGSKSVEDADERLERTCTLCCERGLRIECDRCAVTVAHELTVSAIQTVRGDQ